MLRRKSQRSSELCSPQIKEEKKRGFLAASYIYTYLVARRFSFPQQRAGETTLFVGLLAVLLTGRPSSSSSSSSHEEHGFLPPHLLLPLFLSQDQSNAVVYNFVFLSPPPLLFFLTLFFRSSHRPRCKMNRCCRLLQSALGFPPNCVVLDSDAEGW